MFFRQLLSSKSATPSPQAAAAVLPTQAAPPAVENERGGRLGQMTEMLQAIGSTYSVPFILFYKGYDYQEIATRLDIPVGSVKSRVFSARMKMKQMIAARRQNA